MHFLALEWALQGENVEPEKRSSWRKSALHLAHQDYKKALLEAQKSIDVSPES